MTYRSISPLSPPKSTPMTIFKTYQSGASTGLSPEHITRPGVNILTGILCAYCAIVISGLIRNTIHIKLVTKRKQICYISLHTTGTKEVLLLGCLSHIQWLKEAISCQPLTLDHTVQLCIYIQIETHFDNSTTYLF